MRTHKYNFEKYKNNNYISNIHQINNDPLSEDLLKNSSNNNSMKKSVTLEVNLPIENLLRYNYMNNPKRLNNISSRVNTNSYDYYSPIIYKTSNNNNYIHYISDINDKNQMRKNTNININSINNLNNLSNNHKSSNNINNIRLNNYLKDANNSDSLFAHHQEIKKSKSKQKNKSMNLNSNNNINKQRNKSARNNKLYNTNLFNNNYKNTYDENYFENGNNNMYNNTMKKSKNNNIVNTNVNKRNYLYNHMNKKKTEFISNDFINEKINFNNINIGINNNNFIIDNINNNKANKKYDNNDSIELNLIKEKNNVKDNLILKTENDYKFNNNTIRNNTQNYLGENKQHIKYKTSLSENKYKIPLYHSQNLTRTNNGNNYLSEDWIGNNNYKTRNLSNKNKINNIYNLNSKKNSGNKIYNPQTAKSERIFENKNININKNINQKDNYKNKLENIQKRMKDLLNVYSYLLSNKIKIESNKSSNK